jgi:hypothetical protein
MRRVKTIVKLLLIPVVLFAIIAGCAGRRGGINSPTTPFMGTTSTVAPTGGTRTATMTFTATGIIPGTKTATQTITATNATTATITGTTTPTSTATVTVTAGVVITVNLGMAASFGGFGGNAGMTNEGINTVINGDIGTTAASTLMTGFHDTSGDVYTETPLNIGTVNGVINCAPPSPGTASKFTIAQQALADANTAFNYLAGLPGGPDVGAGEMGGITLFPGTYTSANGSFKITNGDLTLDAQGDPNAVWVFQMASTLTVGQAGQARSVILLNNAQAKNIYWQVGSAATINGTGGGTMNGTIIAYSGVSFSTSGNTILTTLNGRALSLNASVTMVNTVINVQ